jgi:preprotein translocase SecE subunit
MATAVKQNPETMTPSLFDRPAAVSLVGVVYVVGCLGIVFKLLPYVFWSILGWVGEHVFGGAYEFPSNAANNVILGMLILVAATALCIFGARLLGPRAPHGTRAGIFVGVLGAVLVLLLTRWASMAVEHYAAAGWYGPAVGWVIIAAVGLALCAGAVWLFFQPRFETFLVRFEDQGWFSATAFKPQQGYWVRRGTIVGILAIAISGLWTMRNQGILNRLPADWSINIPFTGKTTINLDSFANNAADQFRKLKLEEAFKPQGKEVVVDQYVLRDFNNALTSKYVRVPFETRGNLPVPDDTDYEKYRVMTREAYDNGVRDLKKEIEDGVARELPAAPESLVPVGGTETWSTIQLMPSIAYTLPILLFALALWGAWRIVNYPTFADFLIATEAELNKVSWEPRKRLVQNTYVVLITVVLMAVYLFAADQVWVQVLKWHPIRVLQIPEEQNKAAKPGEKPW